MKKAVRLLYIKTLHNKNILSGKNMKIKLIKLLL